MATSNWKEYVVRVGYDFTEDPNSWLGKGFNDITVSARSEKEAKEKAVKGRGYIMGLTLTIMSVK